MEKHPLHIKDPELQKSEEVSNAVEKQERLEGEKIPNDPVPRIEAYMDRLENIFLNPDEDTRKRNIEMFRDKIYDSLLVKPENFPDSYFELQKRIARERGQAVEEIPENIREQMVNTAIDDQKASLDAWIDYLSSDDAVYPTWFKYYVWKNITKLSQFDKERGEFKKRTSSTVAPFPDIYREPLAQIADAYQKVREDNKNLKDEEVQEIFSKKFPAIYAELIQKTLEQQVESSEEIKGEWVKYEQGNMEDAERLFQSIESKGTGWCTAGRSTAKTQMESGDFYVYYSNDKKGVPSVPRLAIRMSGKNRIAEIRGIMPHQNVELQMQDILDAKLGEFGPEADAYRKKSEDMRILTELEHKQESGDQLSKDELVFLYEIDSPIESFGYGKDPRIAKLLSGRDKQADARILFEKTNFIEEKIAKNETLTKEDLLYLYEVDSPAQGFHKESLRFVSSNTRDPRIDELRSGRDIREDMSIIFECSKDQIVYVIDEVHEDTKVYIGPQEPDIFKKLPDSVEHIFIPTLEYRNRIYRDNIIVDKKAPEQLIEEVEKADVDVDVAVKRTFAHPKFTESNDKEIITLVFLRVASLGFNEWPKIEKFYEKAEELGLELCPMDIGFYYCLKYKDHTEKMDEEEIYIAAEETPSIFTSGMASNIRFGRYGNKLHIRHGWSSPGGGGGLTDRKFAFRLKRKQ